MTTTVTWDHTMTRLKVGAHSFDITELFHKDDAMNFPGLDDFFNPVKHDWGMAEDIFYTRLINEAVLSALSKSPSTYTSVISDADALQGLVKQADKERIVSPVVVLPGSVWGQVYYGPPTEYNHIALEREGSTVTFFYAGDARIICYDTAVSCYYDGQVVSMDLVVPSNRGLCYMTEAITCARLMIRYLGAVEAHNMAHELDRLTSRMREYYLKPQATAEPHWHHYDIRPNGTTLMDLNKAPTVDDICNNRLLGTAKENESVGFRLDEQSGVTVYVPCDASSIRFTPDPKLSWVRILVGNSVVLTCEAQAHTIPPICLLFDEHRRLAHAEFIQATGCCTKSQLTYTCTVEPVFSETPDAVEYVITQLASMGINMTRQDVETALTRLGLQSATQGVLFNNLPYIIDAV